MDEVEGLGFSVSHTTRQPRSGEADGVHYHFVDRPAFERLIADGAFAEWAEVHGNLYGTSFGALEARLAEGSDVILDIDVQGALQIRSRVQGAVLVFVLPPSLGELRCRLEGRGLDGPKTIERRMGNAKGEMALAERYDYLVVNEDVSLATRNLASIIRAERCRTGRRLQLLEEVRSPLETSREPATDA
jgi:guanylate kinase